jgi:hypothetical protein
MFDRECVRGLRGGGDEVAAGGVDQTLVAFGVVVAQLDVVGHGVAEHVPVGVVGVFDHEFGDREEVALDSVEVAGVGRSGDQFEVVGGLVGPGSDLWRPVAGQAVLDPVDAPRAGIGEPGGAHRGQRGVAVSGRPQPGAQIVGVHVVAADQVADAVLAAVVGAQSLAAPPLGPARAVVGNRLIGPISSKEVVP